MKLGSEESTNPRIAGVQKEFVHLFPVTIYENTAMYMVLSIQWTERELLSCHAILQYRMHAGIPESTAVNVPG